MTMLRFQGCRSWPSQPSSFYSSMRALNSVLLRECPRTPLARRTSISPLPCFVPVATPLRSSRMPYPPFLKCPMFFFLSSHIEIGPPDPLWKRFSRNLSGSQVPRRPPLGKLGCPCYPYSVLFSPLGHAAGCAPYGVAVLDRSLTRNARLHRRPVLVFFPLFCSLFVF